MQNQITSVDKPSRSPAPPVDSLGGLQIAIVTYNRARFLERTLETFTAADSPVRDCPILVLDNCSTDDTASVTARFQASCPHLTYHRNNFNIGANANIAKAFESNRRDYIWVVADDDVFDWTNWAGVEAAMQRREKAIIVSRMDLPDQYRDDVAKILHQAAFVSACIFSRSLFDPTVFRNIYDNIHTMFPHLVPLVDHLNHQGRICVLEQQVVKHGIYENRTADDTCWFRGVAESRVYRKHRTISFEVGFCLALSDLKDLRVKHRAIELLIATFDWRSGEQNVERVLGNLIKRYSDEREVTHLVDLFLNVDERFRAPLENAIASRFGVRALLRGVAVRVLARLRRSLRLRRA